MIQATRWLAQLSDGTKMEGGQEGIMPGQVNVASVPLDKIKVFTISHNTFAHTYYAPYKMWYKDGKVWTTYVYPTQYIMQDGSILTVDFANGLLKLTQVVES
jgi:hypothetical protein